MGLYLLGLVFVSVWGGPCWPTATIVNIFFQSVPHLLPTRGAPFIFSSFQVFHLNISLQALFFLSLFPILTMVMYFYLPMLNWVFDFRLV